MNTQAQKGFNRIVLIIAVLFIGILGIIALQVSGSGGGGFGQTEEEKISDTTLKICQDDYKDIKLSAEKTVSPESVEILPFDKFVVEGDYARAGTGCKSSEMRAFEDSAFTGYYHKEGGNWKVYTREQQSPPCAKFDGKGWPIAVSGRCYTTNGQLRNPRS